MKDPEQLPLALDRELASPTVCHGAELPALLARLRAAGREVFAVCRLGNAGWRVIHHAARSPRTPGSAISTLADGKRPPCASQSAARGMSAETSNPEILP